MKIENRDPKNVATTPIHNSGSMRPTPSGPHHDPRAGGEIPRSSLPTLPVSDRSDQA